MSQLAGQGDGLFPGGPDGKGTGAVPVFAELCGAELDAMDIVDTRLQAGSEQVLELGEVAEGDDDGLVHKEPDKVALLVVAIAIPGLDADVAGLDVLGIDAVGCDQVQDPGHDGIVLALGHLEVLVPGLHAQGEDHFVGDDADLGVSGDSDEAGLR